MANEAVIIELLGDGGDVVRYTVADNNALTKGQMLFLADPRKASGAELVAFPCVGIASADKVASDGSTNLGLYTNGIFDLVCGSPVTLGSMVMASGSRYVSGCLISNRAIGMALETGDAKEVIAVKVLI